MWVKRGAFWVRSGRWHDDDALTSKGFFNGEVADRI